MYIYGILEVELMSGESNMLPEIIQQLVIAFLKERAGAFLFLISYV